MAVRCTVWERTVHRTATYRCDDTRCCIIKFWPPDDKHIVLETCRGHIINLFYIYIYIISHHYSREHSALTKFRHLTRFLASTLTSFHVLPWCLISSRIVVLHVVWGLVPRGFHSRGLDESYLWKNTDHMLQKSPSLLVANVFGTGILQWHVMPWNWY